MKNKYQDIRFKFVKLIYADHNSSSIVKNKIKSCISTLKENEIGINIGAGFTKLDSNIRNLDIFPGENIYYVTTADKIPEGDNFFSLAISQEVLEHVKDPFSAVKEIHRVLKKGGLFYCQVPFIIGYHPGPTDFWRFTKEGIEELLVQSGFEVLESGITVGGGTGFYRIAVEFFSTLISLPLPPLYFLFKAIFSVALYPIKFFDLLFAFSPQKDRIPGGYYIIVKK
jgi:SAM-dependent methyltransferase